VNKGNLKFLLNNFFTVINPQWFLGVHSAPPGRFYGYSRVIIKMSAVIF